MRNRRPTTIAGLFGYLLWVLFLRWKWSLLVVLVLVVVATILSFLMGPAALALATFNIENYPKSYEQQDAAVQLMADLDVDLIAVQEITKPALFARNVQRYLGNDWNSLFANDPGRQLVGITYNSSAMELLESRTHRETMIWGGRTTLEARFRTHDWRGERTFRVFVVHLKAFDKGEKIRYEQLQALLPIIQRAAYSEDEIIVMGDFNTITSYDRAVIQRFAEATNLEWHSAHLPCTAYWRRNYDCATSSLDHILAGRTPRSIRAMGACETVGCEPGRSCPTYVKQISDHCPVRVQF